LHIRELHSTPSLGAELAFQFPSLAIWFKRFADPVE
jgi:hypothetical protein